MVNRPTHHAYLLIGERAWALGELRARWQIEEPVWEMATLDIETSRVLKSRQARRLGDGESEHLIIACGEIGWEAQHALLKTLEEPTPGVHFFFLLPVTAAATLLPTLRSRCEIYHQGLPLISRVVLDDEVKKFLAAAPEARLAQVAELLTSAGNDNPAAEGLSLPAAAGRQAGQRFVAALLRELRARGDWSALGAAAPGAALLPTRAAAPRLVLEHLALVLPSIDDN